MAGGVPLARAAGRAQIEAGTLVTNRRHESWRVDEFCRQIRSSGPW